MEQLERITVFDTFAQKDIDRQGRVYTCADSSPVKMRAKMTRESRCYKKSSGTTSKRQRLKPGSYRSA